ncbi:hypothetical protein [Gloeobacter violaceus]|uniref:hypothetical protein n=1 Tax=Gloeobacter violaceus TaxID=33072 RepID=UPI0013E8DAAA|nr:hypothetical protein [Gloeobacter violaceus]
MSTTKAVPHNPGETMVRYKLAAFDPRCHEAWVWWDASRRGFRGEVHCKGTDADPQDSYVLHVGADASIATVQALVEAMGSYASLDIEQKVQLLQDKAATPLPLSQRVDAWVRRFKSVVRILWRMRP